MKPSILFFARDYQQFLFPKLVSEKYDSLYVTMTRSESKELEQQGIISVGCFEDFYALHCQEQESTLEDSSSAYLVTSFFADRFMGKLRQPERRKILSIERRFWAEIFDKYQPVAVVNEIV
ncbi:hypothetical protein, partial [Chitinophaga sp.]|uniref:hypothetical protein n=1 Tax=Chitinophaga sp. TaxID=1869181 RepID=UPI002F934718